MQGISTILKIAPGIILWIQKGWVAGILGLIAAFALTWIFTILAVSSGSVNAIQNSRFWVGPGVFVIILVLGFLIF